MLLLCKSRSMIKTKVIMFLCSFWKFWFSFVPSKKEIIYLGACIRRTLNLLSIFNQNRWLVRPSKRTL
jgi:hypothetical protein